MSYQLSSMPTRIYSPLDREQREIRLLSILPPPLESESDSDSIKCNLRKAQLNDAGEGQTYIALSYTWGDPSKTLPIEVNDETMQVTVNLESALRRLRDKFHLWTTHFWIDAVCL